MRALKAAPRALVVGASETAALLHLPVLEQLRDEGRLELVEICDLRLGSAAEARSRFGFSRHGSDAAAAIGRDDIDVVYLLGSARMHHALGLAALEAGKHLFVEKPIAPSFAEAMQLADAAAERELIAVGGHSRRFLAAFDRIRADAGNGGWTFAEAVFHKPEFGRPPPFGAATWLSGNGIHALDALLFMLGGMPEWLAADTAGSGSIPAIFTATMCWPNGAHAVLLCNNEAGARREEYVFHSPGESCRVTDAGLTIERGGARRFFELPAAADGFAAEHEAFLDAIATDVSPRHAISALAPSLFLAELIEAGHHGPVRLPTKPMTITPSGIHNVLVVGADRLRNALGEMPANWRLVSFEELDSVPESRPDISAAIVAPAAEPLTAGVLDKLPNLSVIGVAGLSLHRYGADRLLERGIILMNASHAYAESVAEFALGLAILGRRLAFASNGTMHESGWGTARQRGGWRQAVLRIARALRPIAARVGLEADLLKVWRSAALAPVQASGPRELRGASVGLVGWGANAAAFARRLTAAGGSVLAWSEHSSPEDIRAGGARPATLAQVLSADIVSLHRGLTPATRHCLGAPELARLRPGSVLINVARGALIEPEALIGRLRKGDAFACLDTFEEEPLQRRHPLRRMGNVFLTSHIAGGSPDMHAAAIREVIGKVAAHLDGGAVETVSADRLAAMT